MIKVYSNLKNHKTYYETWGGSTKHPDSRLCYNDWPLAGKGLVDLSHPMDIVQWLCSAIAETNLMPLDLALALDFVTSAYNAWYNSK